MAKYELERSETMLNEVGNILREWHESRDEDHVYVQDLRYGAISIGTTLMRELVEGVQPEHIVRLKMGNERVRGRIFTRDSYDFLHTSTKWLEPGHELDLKKASLIQWGPPHPPEELYVGFHVRVGITAVAKTLAENGGLQIVEFPKPASTPEI